MNARQAEILEILQRDGKASVQALARRFRVNAMTIRRDLVALQATGRVARTHGGAMLARTGVVEFAFAEKARRNMEQKKAIAAEIAGLVPPGSTVSLDTGTTTLEAARAIAGIPGLTVLTSSLAIASALYARENVNLVLLGGTVRKNSPDLSGPLTEDNLRKFRVSIAVLGADGASPEGVFTLDEGVARVSRAMIAGAEKTILAADSSKFSAAAFVRFAEWSDIDIVVTDEGAPPSVRGWLEKKAGRVIYARPR
ncbi:MAG: DeoR/GlpR family DNA-binding transcription regulator [Planctomycetota bacterium]|nr:DeoR/GlpR family DNA-binding transcription regulator [Planctomycetota bacterium]